MEKKFSKEFLIGVLDASFYDKKNSVVKSDRVIGTERRWSIDHEMIFEHEGKYWSAGYSTGKTESQDESPFEYDGDEIECTEVHEVEKTIKTWESVGA